MPAIDTAKHWIFYGLAASAALLTPAWPSATARAEPPTGKAAGRTGAQGDDFTSYSFEEESVLGTTPAPSGEVLHVRRRGERESLIRVRENFIHELLKSVESL